MTDCESLIESDSLILFADFSKRLISLNMKLYLQLQENLRQANDFTKLLKNFYSNIYIYISLIQEWHHNSKLFLKSDKDATFLPKLFL